MVKLKQLIANTRTWLEDRVLTRPLPWYSAPEDAQSAARVDDIRSNGYTSLAQVFDTQTVGEIRDAISSAIEGTATGSTAVWSEKVEYWKIDKPLNLHPALLDVAASTDVVEVAEAYFGRRCFLADVDVRRVMPVDMAELEKRGISSSNWHRDNRGRQLKLMAYLTDVSEADSCFSFHPSTHHGEAWRKLAYDQTRFTDEDVAALNVERHDWIGRAGEAMLFDTNLIHKLTRKTSARVRDTVTFYFTPGQALAELDINAKPLDPNAVRMLDKSPFSPRH